MQPRILLLAFLVASFYSLLWTGSVVQKRPQIKTHENAGDQGQVWTAIYEESGERVKHVIVDPSILLEHLKEARQHNIRLPLPKDVLPGALFWRFSSDQLEISPADPNLKPQEEKRQFEIAGQNADTPTFIPLDDVGKPKLKENEEAISFTVDDFKIICRGPVRPKEFNTVPGSKNILTVLRKGKPKLE